MRQSTWRSLVCRCCHILITYFSFLPDGMAEGEEDVAAIPCLLKSWCLLSFTISSFAWHVFSIVKEKCSRTLIVQVMDVMQAHLVFMKNNYLFYAWTSSSSHSWTENLFPWMLASGTLEIFQSDVIYNQIKAATLETEKSQTNS